MSELFNYFTTGEDKIEGKTKILICYHEAEAEPMAKLAITELMDLCENAVLLYPAQSEAIGKDREYTQQILASVGTVDGVFVCVTGKMLSEEKSYAKTLIGMAFAQGKHILPFFCEPKLFAGWNKFLPVQAIDPFNSDPTQLSYKIKISNWIDKIALLSENEIGKIWNSFSYRIFLSYRKVDRKYVLPLMHSIQEDMKNNPLALSGIWYDEALTSDDRFDDIIAEKISESDIYLMLITPNTFAPNAEGKPNYVLSMEYPAFEESDKDIIGILTPDADVELAKQYFPKVNAFVSINDEKTIRGLILQSIGNTKDLNSISAEDFYYNGLAYVKGVGTAENLENAASLFFHAINFGSHKEALRRIVDICFDENEKLKGEEGLYSPSDGLQYQMKLIRMLADEIDGSDSTVKAFFKEQLRMTELMISVGDKEYLDKARESAMAALSWIKRENAKTPSNFLNILEGRALIEVGMVQYLRHIYRGPNRQMRELGAIAYLPEGIEKMLSRGQQASFSLEEIYTISNACDCLADSYYKQARFSEQRNILMKKLDFIEKYALNEMDRAQLIERAQTYSLLAEATLMCSKELIDDALKANQAAEDLLEKATVLRDDSIVFLQEIRHYNGWSLAWLCKMDDSRVPEHRTHYYNEALKVLDFASHMLEEEFRSRQRGIDDKTLHYWYGVTKLHLYQTKKNTEQNPELAKLAYKQINTSVSAASDYDAFNYLYRAVLETAIIEINEATASEENLNLNTLNAIEQKLNRVIDDIEKDTAKHNDYWISLDRLELYYAKALFMFKLHDIGPGYFDSQKLLEEINQNLYIAYSYGRNLCEKEGAEKSRVLMGAMCNICKSYSKYYTLSGDIAEANRMLVMASEYGSEGKNLNDYMR